MCFNALSGSGPAYLPELLHIYTPSRTLRSSSDTRMLEIQQYKRKTHGFRAFSCFGPIYICNQCKQLNRFETVCPVRFMTVVSKQINYVRFKAKKLIIFM